jgi:hypothetical protein
MSQTDVVSKHGTQALLFSITKALHKAVGGNTAAVLRSASSDMLEEFAALGIEDLSSNDITVLQNSFRNVFRELKFCEDIRFENDGNNWRMHVHGCSMYELTLHLKENGIPPFACPFASIAVALAEKNLGVRARVHDITTNGTIKGSTITISL